MALQLLAMGRAYHQQPEGYDEITLLVFWTQPTNVRAKHKNMAGEEYLSGISWEEVKHNNIEGDKDTIDVWNA